MRLVRAWFVRLGEFLFRPRRDLELAAELETHLQMYIEDRVRCGATLEEARRQAVLVLGGVEQAKENYRDYRGLPTLEAIIQDVSFGLRLLRKNPGFTAAAVLTLALGIGATTAIFTLVHAVLLSSLPVVRPSELYRVGDVENCCVQGGLGNDDNWSLFSYEQYKMFRDNTPGFAELAAFQAGATMVGVRRANGNQLAQSMRSEFVSGNYFATLGVRPYVGRIVGPDDDRKGAPAVAVISYRSWREMFGGDAAVVGAAFTINNQPFTVIGVAPPAFFGDRRTYLPDFWIPISDEPLIDGPRALIGFPQQQWLDMIGRIAPGADPKQIGARMQVELQQWLLSPIAQLPSGLRDLIPRQTLRLSPGGAGLQTLRNKYVSSLHLLMWISALVLAIACANVANLMLVRATARKVQTCIQSALGAPISRQIRQVLIECGLLALIGAFGGVALAFVGTRLILRLAFREGSVAIQASPSLPVLAFTFAVSLVTGIVFGIAPSWITAKTAPADVLRSAGTARSRGGWAQRSLVVAQAGLSVVLVVAAWLMTQSFRQMRGQDFGFDTANRYVLHFDPQMAGYKPAEMQPLFQKLNESLGGIPGVKQVSFSLYTPMDGNNWGEHVFIQGQAPPPVDSDETLTSWLRVSPGYFETLGTKIIQGRSFTEQDSPTSQPVAVVNRTFAKKFFNGDSVIGNHFGFGIDLKKYGDFEIVGVTEDTKYRDPAKEPPPMFFLPSTQSVTFDDPRGVVFDEQSHVLSAVELSTFGKVPGLEAEVRRALANVNPNLAVINFRSFENQLNNAFSQQTMIVTLTSLFGLLALVLASVGLYGVTAYSVSQRTNEIGVRMALGAARGDVLRLVLREGGKLVLIGVAIGVVGRWD